MRSIALFFSGVFGVLTLGGCASVSVHKINSATGQVDTGAPEGLRFYMPRPYLSVFEPFIVSSDAYIAKGELSPDGNYVLLTQVPAGLDAIVNRGLQQGSTQTMGSLAIDSSTVLVARDAGTPQAAAVEEATKPESPNGNEDADKGRKDASAPRNGILNYKAINDNALFAITPQPRYFNILWLPDFEEKYVVTAKAGLGNSGVTLNLGQGWSLQGLDASVDNSAMAKPLLDFYTGTLEALQKVATAKIQAPLALLAGGPHAAPVGGVPPAKGAPPTAKTEFQGGTPVTVKVTKVRIVAPGLYPILKPSETATLSADEQKRILGPKPPFTNIAFNTYDAVVIEAARATGDTALRIHQYVDSAGPGRAGTATPDDIAQPGPFKEAEARVNAELSRPEVMAKSGEYYLATITSDGSTVKVQLRKRSGGSGGKADALLDEQAAKKLVIETLKALKISVTSENITVPK